MSTEALSWLRLANVKHGGTGTCPSRNLRPRRWRRALFDCGRRQNTSCQERVAASPLPFDTDDHLTLAPKRKTGSRKGLEMVAGGDGATNAPSRADGPELVQLTIVLVPDLIRAAIRLEVTVARAVGVVGGVVHAEGFHHIVLALMNTLVWGMHIDIVGA